MREITYPIIVGNPNIKRHDKPRTPADIYRICDDNKKVSEAVTEKDVERIQNKFFK